MKYFKNTEASRIYRVSEKSIRNWIVAAKNGKLDLQLHEENGRSFLANTAKNQQRIEELVQRGQKYKNSRTFKTVTPSPQLYEIFTEKQIFDIFLNLDIHREIPLQYTYINGNAHHWDKYAERLMEEEDLNTLTATIKLLEISYPYLAELAAPYHSVNIVDLGLGNAMPVKGLLNHLIADDHLHRYLGIDISEEMLKIAEGNLKKWFGKDFTIEKYTKDISRDQFGRLTANDAFAKEGSKLINIVLLLGGTITNFRQPNHALRLMNASMGKDDVLIYTDKLDTMATRRYFDFHPSNGTSPLNPRHKAILDLLQIDESLYEVRQFYDEQKHMRMITIKLKVDICINFTLGNLEKQITLGKGEDILIWRARHQTSREIIERFDRQGFELLYASTTPNQQFLLTVSRIKREQ